VKRLMLLSLLVAGCRGSVSDKPPIHLVPDMDWQQSYRMEESSDLLRSDGTPVFADGRAMRPLVPGVVPVGHLNEDESFHRGIVGDKYVAKVPFDVDEKVVLRGQERYNIYCAPCHDKTGSGNGMVVVRGNYPKPVDLISDRVRTMADGQVFDTISKGKGNMPPYGKQIPAEDRWNIVAYLRVLQRSQHATIDDVPSEQRGNIQLQGTTR
jgi:cytochrome c